MHDLIGSSKVERIAILLSYNGTSKFLGAPKIPSATGKNIADIVYKKLEQWDVVDQVKALSFDATSTNTGIEKGATTLLEKVIGRKLIHLACRHHIYEIILRSVFELKLGSTTAPEVPLFERFQSSWPNLNKEEFEVVDEDEIINEKLNSNDREVMIKFCREKLAGTLIRDDYKELLQLALIFLGAERYTFRSPIYALKIFMFRKQFKLSKQQICGLRDICIFLIKIYIKTWFCCTNAISAPFQDLSFIQETLKYKNIDFEVATAVLNKINNHLWYIAEDTVALAFFDLDISIEEKIKMLERLAFEEPVVKLENNRKLSDLSNFNEYSISDFVSEKTKNFFTTFGLSTEFLSTDPALWENSLEFEDGWSFCQNLFVVNETAEKGVKFMHDFNKILTHDEEEKQLLLQVVEAHRCEYPTYKKSALI